VDNIESWWWELIILPRSIMIRAGIGFSETRYWRGCCHDSSCEFECARDETTALLRRSRIFVDSMIIPN
jgi:hypothetical protein